MYTTICHFQNLSKNYRFRIQIAALTSNKHKVNPTCENFYFFLEPVAGTKIMRYCAFARKTKTLQLQPHSSGMLELV